LSNPSRRFAGGTRLAGLEEARKGGSEGGEELRPFCKKETAEAKGKVAQEKAE